MPWEGQVSPGMRRRDHVSSPVMSTTSRIPLHWLETTGVAESPGAAFGVPWPQGELSAGTAFSLRAADRTEIPVQSWPLAYWPDGSLKWSGHAVCAAGMDAAGGFTITPGKPAAPAVPVTVRDEGDAFIVDTGAIRC